MSIGNLKTQGGKGTNWPWQYRMLLGLDKIAAAVATGGKDYESDLISIKCGASPAITRLEVRIYDPSVPSWTIKLYPPGSTVEDTTDYSACTKTYLDAGDASEVTLEACRVLLSTIDTDTGNIKTNTDKLGASATPTIIRATASLSVTIADEVKSISFYNASASDDAHVNTVDLKPGETVNFDAGGNGNYFAGSSFTYDADPDAGGNGDLLIIYVE